MAGDEQPALQHRRAAQPPRPFVPPHTAAQRVATALYHEIDPACFVLIGIAGSKPEPDFILGDVIVGDTVLRFQRRGGAGRWDNRDLGRRRAETTADQQSLSHIHTVCSRPHVQRPA
jgi:hypothetical protein